jgi:hypothetical protein
LYLSTNIPHILKLSLQRISFGHLMENLSLAILSKFSQIDIPIKNGLNFRFSFDKKFSLIFKVVKTFPL